jgi:AraC-like DNA-binding protein
MRPGSVTAITPQILIQECSRQGVSKETLLNEAGIPHEAIHSPSGQIPFETMCALWKNALRLSEDPMLALHVAEKIPFGAYRLLDYMLAASATPREGLFRNSRSFNIMNNAFVVVFRLHRDLAYLELHSPRNPRHVPRPYIEYILTLYLTRLCFVTQAKCKPLEVHVTYAQPRSVNEYERIFGARVRFNQPVNRLVFGGQSMDIPHPLADPELCEVLEHHAQRSLASSNDQKYPLGEIRKALVHNLANAKASLGDLSMELGLSSRSLQRKILENGMTFRRLLDSVRQERAAHLLQNPGLSIKEIASMLNFSDISSFSHAFYRWTGSTPTDYRKTLQPSR